MSMFTVRHGWTRRCFDFEIPLLIFGWLWLDLLFSYLLRDFFFCLLVRVIITALANIIINALLWHFLLLWLSWLLSVRINFSRWLLVSSCGFNMQFILFLLIVLTLLLLWSVDLLDFLSVINLSLVLILLLSSLFWDWLRFFSSRLLDSVERLRFLFKIYVLFALLFFLFS